jgi:hypothetical protein
MLDLFVHLHYPPDLLAITAVLPASTPVNNPLEGRDISLVKYRDHNAPALAGGWSAQIGERGDISGLLACIREGCTHIVASMKGYRNV